MTISGNLARSASGLDVEGLISKLVAIRTQSVTTLQARQQQINSANSTVSGFSGKLSALARAARALDSSTEFNTTSAGSSDAASVAATSTGGTVPGSYNVSVTRLASEQRTRSNSFASSTTALNLSGTIDVSVAGGAPVTVTLSAADTLNDVASRLSTTSARLNASVIYDGTNYQMLVRGLDSGDANTVTFSASDPATAAALGLNTPANTYQTAQDALFTVDATPMRRPTNQVTSAIPGVTLALARVTTAPAQITVATDPATLKTKVQSFVAAYNDVVTASHTATGFGTAKASNSVLAADRTFRGSLQRLSQLVSGAVAGTSGSYTTLGSVGVRLQSDGTLQINDAAFNAALTADPLAVSKVFVTNASIGATGVMSAFDAAVTGLISDTSSPVLSRGATLSAQSQRLGARITDEQEAVAAYSATLRAQFSAMEAVVSKYSSYL
jgi:flagellar hook-associated protein 2